MAGRDGDDIPCDIRASVTTGLEGLAADEVAEKLCMCDDVKHGRGFVTWSQPAKHCIQALNLKVVENLEVVMSTFEVNFSKDPAAALEQMSDLLTGVNWTTGLNVWSRFAQFDGPLTADDMQPTSTNEDDSKLPAFRATCHRTGQNHSFSSPEVAHKLGGLIGDMFGWRVNLKNFDIEVVIHIVDEQISFNLALNKESLFKRNIGHFSRTTLKATICAGLLRLADIKPGDVVVDPMCGAGSITIEGAIEHPTAFHVAGDNQEFCVECSRNNIIDMNQQRAKDGTTKLSAGVLLWDATNLPLSTSSVDVIVSDLPFGKRMGSKVDNRKLYPGFLTEAARVTVPCSGRAVLLTTDKNCMSRVLPTVKEWWSVPRTSFINHGGLRACAYVLKRTARLW